MRACRLVLFVGIVLAPAPASVRIAPAGQTTPSSAPAAEAGALHQQASVDIGRLQNDIPAKEASWRSMFVRRLKRGEALMREDDVFEPLRHAQRLVDDLRRELRDLEASRARGALDAAQQVDRLADLTARAALGRWQLGLDETSLTVELARQTYEATAAETRRLRERPSQVEAAARREREARDAAISSLGLARDRLGRARQSALDVLGALGQRLRRAGRAKAADAVAAQMDAELNVSSSGQAGVPTSLDRFLAAQTIVFESAADNDHPEPATLAGALTAIDIKRISIAPAAKTLAFVRYAPLAVGYERAVDLGFGRSLRVEVEFDSDPDTAEHNVVLEWREGADNRTLAVPLRTGKGRIHYSEIIEIWPAGRTVIGQVPPAAPAPARPGGISGFDSPSNQPQTPPPGSNALDAAIRKARGEVTRISGELTPLGSALTGPGQVRERAFALRDSADRLRRTLPPPPPAAGAAMRALAAFRTRWENLAEPVWTGRPLNELMEPARFAGLASGFNRPPCQGLRSPVRPVRLAGLEWACLSDAFFEELVKLEGEVERVTQAIRQRETGALEAAIAEVEDGLAPAKAPAATQVARGIWLREMTGRILRAEIEAAKLRLLALERRRDLTADRTSPYGWFVTWSARTASAEEWRWAAYVLRAAPGATIRASFGGVMADAKVEAAAPRETAAFFARALYDTHDQKRRLKSEARRAVDRDLREYEAALERRFATAGTGEYENSRTAELRRLAVEEQRRRLLAAADERLKAAIERLSRAREQALAAIRG